ncbi:MAG: SpoIIE family protein phosphatase [Acidobacteria bacterium]|nr:SpoIIE family protein phosphatase [Acidobacteriota bacterium]
MPILVFKSGPRKGERFSFEKGALLGRGPLADLELHDPAVSRRHAQISFSEEDCFVADLESGNGTYVNGQRVADPVRLEEGDEIRVGATCLEFRPNAKRGRDLSLISKILLHDRHPSTDSKTMSRSVVIPLSGRGVATTSRSTLAAQVSVLQQRVEFVNAVGRIAARSLDAPTILGEVLRQVLEILPQADRAFVVLYEKDPEAFVPCAARTRSGSATEIPASRTLLQEVVRKRHALLATDVGGEEKFSAAQSVRALGLRSVACVPLVSEDEVYGVLQVDNSERSRKFAEEELDVLVGVSGTIALALANIKMHRQLVDRELLEHDLQLARRIQKHFLPRKLPSLPGWGFAIEYSPALAVGGDLYDLVPLPDGRLALAVGDVSGKGVSASLMMARLTSELRAAAVRRASAAAVLEDLNEVVHAEATEGMFVTLLYGILDPPTGRLELANAGHLRPVLRHPDGRCGELEIATGAALGFKRPLGARAYAVTLKPGDRIALFSDGLTEAANEARELFGAGRIVEAMRREGGGSEPLLAAILHKVRSFLGDRTFDDDLTVVCFGREA